MYHVTTILLLGVGISCAMGRHRSIAMAEELAKLSWLGWWVERRASSHFKDAWNLEEVGKTGELAGVLACRDEHLE